MVTIKLCGDLLKRIHNSEFVSPTKETIDLTWSSWELVVERARCVQQRVLQNPATDCLLFLAQRPTHPPPSPTRFVARSGPTPPPPPTRRWPRSRNPLPSHNPNHSRRFLRSRRCPGNRPFLRSI